MTEAHPFEWSPTDEPHKTRRLDIQKKHPEVRALSGRDPVFKWFCVGGVVLQLVLAGLVGHAATPWPAVLACAYLIGGTVNHAMTLAMHETSHYLAFTRPSYNRLFGMFVNLPLGIPAFASFLRYHREHHAYQGADGIDTDVPTAREAAIFTNPVLKAFWMFIQPLFYALRPMCVAPKAPTGWEAANISAQVAFDAAVYYFLGPKALVYLVAGTLLGMGLHPMAGHFVAEHYTFIRGQETYSYYGPLNWLSFNVGFHNEHHDFPSVPGSRLAQLREVAPEQYADLPFHSSWLMVIVRYICDPAVGPWSRVKRAAPADFEPS